MTVDRESPVPIISETPEERAFKAVVKVFTRVGRAIDQKISNLGISLDPSVVTGNGTEEQVPETSKK